MAIGISDKDPFEHESATKKHKSQPPSAETIRTLNQIKTFVQQTQRDIEKLQTETRLYRLEQRYQTFSAYAQKLNQAREWIEHTLRDSNLTLEQRNILREKQEKVFYAFDSCTNEMLQLHYEIKQLQNGPTYNE